MRIFKLIGALVVVLAFSAVAVATASAAETLWKLLPGTVGETFTGKSGKATLQIKGGASIKCEKSTILLTSEEVEGKPKSELLKEGSTEGKDATLALAVIKFEGCNSAGLEAHSLGDSAKIILVHVEIHTCMIKKEHFGLLIKPLLVHLEVPEAKQLIEVLGDLVALLEALPTEPKHFELNITQVAGVQGIEKCEGGEKETLESSVNHGPYIQSGEEAKEGLLLFDGTFDKAGETMMEK
jgi:hypothetical protein